MGWKVKRASKGYDLHPQIRYGARPTEQDGQISALILPMSVLVFDVREPQTRMPAFVGIQLSEAAGFGFVLAPHTAPGSRSRVASTDGGPACSLYGV
jgi:hypothetical protein